VYKEFLGRGWAFPFRINAANGGVETSEYAENIRDCITVILGTRPGERKNLPEFGCRIHDMMFAPNTHASAVIMASHVRQALARWEPRIEVTDVQASAEHGGPTRVQVSYKILVTMSEQELDLLLTSNE
jgi:phage baseplate assembly protein W